jgi:hypothetical protein
MVTVDTGVVSRAHPQEHVCGDGVGIWRDECSTLVAVVDGLGSGQPAADATTAALACVAEYQHEIPAVILDRCHKAVQHTRGVVMALAQIEHELEALTFVGVGNIGFSAAAAQPMCPYSQSGVVGHRLPELRTFRFACSAGDRIALYSDGISSRFVRQGGISILRGSSPQVMAQYLVEEFGQQNDDVAVAILAIAGPAH